MGSRNTTMSPRVRRARPDAAGEQRRRERERIFAVAVGIFRDEQVVADQQRLLHRPGRNVERLEQEGADHQRDDERVEDHAHRLGDAAFFSLRARRHAHLFPVLSLARPRSRSSRWASGAQSSRRKLMRALDAENNLVISCMLSGNQNPTGDGSGKRWRHGWPRRHRWVGVQPLGNMPADKPDMGQQARRRRPARPTLARNAQLREAAAISSNTGSIPLAEVTL